MTQQKSKTLRKGEPLDHEMAVSEVYHFLNVNKKEARWLIDINVPVTYPTKIIKQLPTGRQYKGHTFDLAIYEAIYDKESESIIDLKAIAYIEINGNIGYDYLDGAGRIAHANPTKHSKDIQKRNDKINKNYCEDEGIIYKTLLKEEINGDLRDPDKLKNTQLYLRRELLEFIK